MDRLAARRLLCVHAHPDDESIFQGATLAKYVAEGAHVTVVTCTAGELGEVLVPELAHLAADQEDRLGEHRRGELEDAMRALGVTDHRFLGGYGRFRDSGMQWHADGYAIPSDDVDDRSFWTADLTAASAELVSVIREVRPQVLATYDEFGAYGHPDHIQAHRVATYAACLAAAPSFRPQLGAAHDISKIYWVANYGSMLMTAEEFVTAEIDGRAFADQKVAAMKAYPTQMTPDSLAFREVVESGPEAVGIEKYRLVKGVSQPAEGSTHEDDLFAGLQ